MKVILTVLFLALTTNFVYAQNDGEAVKFRSKIGFAKEEDMIITHKFFDNGKKVVLIGAKNLQFWDVENAKLINSVPHQIPQFAPRGFSNILLLGIPSILNWQPYFIEPDGKWLITLERTSDKKIKTAVVRDLQTGKQIKTLETPNVSIDYLSFDAAKNEIDTYGELDGVTTYAKWDKDTLELKKSVTVSNLTWSQFVGNDEKIVVNVESVKASKNGAATKHDASLTLRDVKTGAVEKQYSAPNLISESNFFRATISKDEKLLMAQRDDRLFVWDIGGNGSPRFEISLQNTKENIENVSVIGDMIVISVDKKLRFYDLGGDGKLKYELASDKLNDSVRISSKTEDGKYIAVVDDQKVSVLETAGSGKPVYEIVRQNEKERIPIVKFTDEDKLLAVERVNSSDKQTPRTEFYDTKTGKIVFTAPFATGEQISFTGDKKYLFAKALGSTTVMNVADQRTFTITQKVYYPDTSKNEILTGTSHNIEETALSPDEKLIVKYGDDVVTVYDIETGKEIQTVFDPERVKYNKQNKIKKSGLGDAGWTMDGKYLFAFDGSGFRDRTVSFWQVLK